MSKITRTKPVAKSRTAKPAPIALDRDAGGRWRVRVRCGESRWRITLAQVGKPAALRRAALVAELAHLVRDRMPIEAREIVDDAASADRSEAEVLAAIERAKAVRARPTREETFRSVADKWTSGWLAKHYPGLKGVRFRSTNWASRLEAMMPYIGDVTIRSFSTKHATHALRNLPDRVQGWRTRGNYLYLIRRVLTLAMFPLEIIDRHPLPESYQVEAGHTRTWPYLYPEEDARLMACAAIPLERRVLWGLLAREGMRVEEACRIDLGCLPGEGRFRLDKNKTSNPRAWMLWPGVENAIRILARRRPSIFAGVNHDPERLRADLLLAGIDRLELMMQTRERGQMRVHDLRASFITVALASGRTTEWCSVRSGHSLRNIERYRRRSHEVADIDVGVWQPLDVALGLVKTENSAGNPPRGGRRGRSGPNRGPGAESKSKLSTRKLRVNSPRPEGFAPNHSTTTGSDEKQREATNCEELTHAGRGKRREATTRPTPRGPTSGLEEAIVEASKAGRWDLVERLISVVKTGT